MLGGRVAEELVFNEISAGASNDIERVTKIAKMMVKSFGMSKLGPVQYDDPTGNVFLGRDYGKGNDYSHEIAFEIDKEIREIINECYKNCKAIISEHMDLLKLIAETLFEEETITNEQIMNLVDHGTIEPLEETDKEATPETKISDSNPNEETNENVEVKPKKTTRKRKTEEKPSFEDAMKEVTGDAPVAKKRGRKKKTEVATENKESNDSTNEA